MRVSWGVCVIQETFSLLQKTIWGVSRECGNEAEEVLDALCVLSTQSCLTLCNPLDCSPPGSSVHGILWARILEWVAMTSSRGSSRPRNRTPIS